MIELKEVTKEYSKGVAALNGINLTIEQGEFVFIVGDSGSGKSTLIKLIMKELEPTSGTIIVNGQNLNRMKHRKIPMYRRNIGVVFQDFRLLKDRNIYDNIAFAQRVTETPTRIIKKKVPAALSLVGLAQKYKSFPKELSGGEQQRVAIARAIVNEPAILLADEPTGNLDPTNSWEIMKLLEEANDRGTTVLVVTHNQEIVNEMKKRVVTMKKGVIVSDEKKGINLTIEQGEFVFIVGDSGSGKSTLIKLIMKELEPTSGTIIVNGQNLNRMKHRKIPMYRRNIGVVFQDFRLLKDRNIYDNIAFAQRVTETPTRIIKKKVPAALSLVGLAQKYKSFPKELSGGEQQRVAIARAIVNEPAILLADEPTGNLDPTNSWEIMKLLEEANDRGTTVLVVTHNQEIVNEMKKRVVTMKKGVIVSDEKKGGYNNEN